MMSANDLHPDGEGQFYEIWECTRTSCGLRFPISGEEAGRVTWNGTCPRCGAPMRAVGRYPCSGGENVPFPARTANERLDNEWKSLRALLDNVRSTWNVGSMLRTADGAGIEHVYLCGITPGGDHPKTAAAALGAESSVPWSRHANALRVCQELKQAGWRLWALESGPSEGGAQVASIFEPFNQQEPRPDRVLLVAGNERLGVDAHILAECERILTIPMLGRKGSLNVAVAFGIAAYRLRFPG